MNLSSYTTINLSGDHSINAPSLTNPSNQLERILLVLIAAIGILGSAYIFSASSNNSPTPEYNNLATVAALSTQLDDEEDEWKVKFKNFFSIKGKKKVDNPITFTFIGDLNDTRYVLEMGNGHRMILTAKSFPFTYKKAGKYTLELKKIERGLISTVATKKIKIRK